MVKKRDGIRDARGGKTQQLGMLPLGASVAPSEGSKGRNFMLDSDSDSGRASSHGNAIRVQ